MKLRNKIAAITAAAMLAFTGVGFAAWAFTNVESAVNNPTNVVTCAVETENVAFYNGASPLTNLYLVFDAPTSGITNKVAAGDGIFFSTSNDGLNPITALTVKAELNHVDNDTHYKDAQYKGIFEDSKALTDPNSYLSTVTAGSFSDNNIVLSGLTSEVEVTYTLPTFDYTTAFKNAVTDADHLAALFTGISLTLQVDFHLDSII